MPKTMQQAAQSALDCQNACNLSGVLHDFEDIVMNTLWPEANRIGQGTDWVNQHPICTLFLNKLCSLNRAYPCEPTGSTFSRAYDECVTISKQTGGESLEDLSERPTERP